MPESEEKLDLYERAEKTLGAVNRTLSLLEVMATCSARRGEEQPTRRDYFAAAALKGLLASAGRHSIKDPKNYPKEAFWMADLMLEERKPKEKKEEAKDGEPPAPPKDDDHQPIRTIG